MADEGIYDYIRRRAKAEKELEVERWAVITIESKERGVLYRYNLPVHLTDRWAWVIRWREAKLICKYPKDNIQRYYSTYYNRKGIYMGYNEDFRTLISAKAQVTKVENAIKSYLESKQGDLFFDEENDDTLIKARMKLAEKIANVEAAEKRMKEKYNQAIQNQNGNNS